MWKIAHVPFSQHPVPCLNILIKKGRSSGQRHINSKGNIFTVTGFKIKLFNKSIVSVENWTVVPRLIVSQDIPDFYVSCLYKKNLEERTKP